MQTTDLASLPVDAVIRAHDGRVWQKWGRDTWQPIGLDSPVREHEGIIKQPVTVLDDPDREQYIAVEFSTSNAAFAKEDGSLDRMEAASILMQAADNIVARSDGDTLLDVNGNAVGTYRVWT